MKKGGDIQMKRNMKWEYNKLKGRIKEIFETQENLAKSIKLSATSLNYKINNQIQFRQEEIYLITEALAIEDKEMKSYFFTPLVEKTQ